MKIIKCNCGHGKFIVDNDLSGYVPDEMPKFLTGGIDGNTEINFTYVTHYKCAKCFEPLPEPISGPPPQLLTITFTIDNKPNNENFTINN